MRNNYYKLVTKSALYLEGHGKMCPECRNGLVLTVMSRQGPLAGERFLACSTYPSCGYSNWPVQPLQGDGEKCDRCNPGVMKTMWYTRRDGSNNTALFCDRGPDRCRNMKFPAREIVPAAAHGQPCPACAEGKLITREFHKRSTRTIYRYLRCDRHPVCEYKEWASKSLSDNIDLRSLTS